MRTHFVVVPPPCFDDYLRLARDRNHSRLRHSSRNLPLKLSVTSLQASTGHRKFDVVPAPVIADRLISFARFGKLPVRFTFGQMVFATDKLKEEGFRPRFGLEHLYREAIGRISAT